MDMLKFRVYPEGELNRAKVIEATNPFNAVCEYGDEHCEAERRPVNLVVVPMFHVEVGAKSPWKSDKEEPIYRLFVITPYRRWGAGEVSTFNPRQMRDIGPLPFVDEVWGYACSEEAEGWTGSFASRDDAIAAGRAQYASRDNEIGYALDAFWIVRGTRPDPAKFIHKAKTLVEWMNETACEDEEHDPDTIPVDWPKVTPEALAELDTFLKAWARKHATCTFWQSTGEPEQIPVIEEPSRG